MIPSLPPQIITIKETEVVIPPRRNSVAQRDYAKQLYSSA